MRGEDEEILRRLVAEAVRLELQEFKLFGGGDGPRRGGRGGGGGGTQGWFRRLLLKFKDRIWDGEDSGGGGRSFRRGSSPAPRGKKPAPSRALRGSEFADSHEDLVDTLGEDPTVGELASALRVNPRAVIDHVSGDAAWELRGSGLDATVHKAEQKKGKEKKGAPR